jgi:hypothetical protein
LRRGGWIVNVLLFLLVLVSLALNAYLIRQWLIFRERAEALEEQAAGLIDKALRYEQLAFDLRDAALVEIPRYRQELQGLQGMTFEYLVQIDENFPVDAVVPFQERLEVPIQTTVPISHAVETAFDLEIRQFGLSIPVEVTVPIQLEVPIDLSVPVEIDRDIAIQTTVPISLEVPIAIDLADTGLLEYVELLDQALAQLENTLAGELDPPGIE